jgi:hypothetical protein
MKTLTTEKPYVDRYKPGAVLSFLWINKKNLLRQYMTRKCVGKIGSKM